MADCYHYQEIKISSHLTQSKASIINEVNMQHVVCKHHYSGSLVRHETVKLLTDKSNNSATKKVIDKPQTNAITDVILYALPKFRFGPEDGFQGHKQQHC